jgi:TfoX/Sxy family transcriptional regulator of competence genes
MFGGSCFLYKGKMCVGETNERLMVRVVSEKMKEVMAHPHVSPMDVTGKPMKEFIFVSEKGFDTEEKLQHWIELGIEHAQLKSK